MKGGIKTSKAASDQNDPTFEAKKKVGGNHGAKGRLIAVGSRKVRNTRGKGGVDGGGIKLPEPKVLCAQEKNTLNTRAKEKKNPLQGKVRIVSAGGNRDLSCWKMEKDINTQNLSKEKLVPLVED